MIIDTHIHIYDPTRPEGVPFPEPDDEIYRRVMPEDYRALVASEGVTGAIIVEASTWVEDNQWVLDVIEDDPFIVGLVGNLDPRAEDFGDHLNRLSPNPLFWVFVRAPIPGSERIWARWRVLLKSSSNTISNSIRGSMKRLSKSRVVCPIFAL